MSSLPTTRVWGLTVPGRAQTPSEGHAQSYARIGPAETQALLAFDNGTCLSFGPDDPVDEFALGLHPFGEQVLLIDKAIRDCKAERTRHEGSGGYNSVFDGFRSQRIPEDQVSVVELDLGTYIQVPSRYASINAVPSVYAHPNKSDWFGFSHPGLSTDTRFGVTVPPAPAVAVNPNNQSQSSRKRRAGQGRGRGNRQGGNGSGRRGGGNALANNPHVSQGTGNNYMGGGYGGGGGAYYNMSSNLGGRHQGAAGGANVSAAPTPWETPVLNAAGLVRVDRGQYRPSSADADAGEGFMLHHARRSSSVANLRGRYSGM